MDNQGIERRVVAKLRLELEAGLHNSTPAKADRPGGRKREAGAGAAAAAVNPKASVHVAVPNRSAAPRLLSAMAGHASAATSRTIVSSHFSVT